MTTSGNKFLSGRLIKSARELLDSFDGVDVKDRSLVLKVIKSVPIPEKITNVSALMSETGEMDATISTLSLKYTDALDQLEAHLDMVRAGIANTEIEARDKVSRSTPSHIIDAKLSFSPKYVEARKKANRLKRFVELLDAMKWMIVRRHEAVQAIYHKEF